MKLLWKLSKEATRYRGLYVIAILATLSLTLINLVSPRILASMTSIVEQGVDPTKLNEASRRYLIRKLSIEF